MFFLLSMIAAIIPTVIYVALIYWVDRYEKEPIWLLAAAFLWGAVPSIIAALIFNTLFSIPFFIVGGEGLGNMMAAVLIAPPVEESLKGLALVAIFFLWRHEIDSVLDGIIYGAMVGMGFAMVENFFYFMSEYSRGGYEAWRVNVLLRAVIFGLNHALFTSMTGLGLAIARLSKNRLTRVSAPILGWMAAVFLHFVHNASASLAAALPIFCLILPINAWGGVLITLLIIIWALVQEKRWLKKYLAEEVDLGTLTAAQYETAASSRRRFQHRWQLLFADGPIAYHNANRFYNRCSKLAYAKHHLTFMEDEKGKQMMLKLRKEVATLSLLIPQQITLPVSVQPTKDL